MSKDSGMLVRASQYSTDQRQLTGYDALKQSSLLWSMPVQCQQFLTTSLTPEAWVSKFTDSGAIDPIFAKFGLAISKSLKSVADIAWEKKPIPKGFDIDLLKHAPAQKYGQYIEILVLIRAMDIACKFLRVPSRAFYPKFSKPLELDDRMKKFINRLDHWPKKLEGMNLNLRTSNEANLVTLPPLEPTATLEDRILHDDVCILAAQWKHDSVKQLVKSLSVLEGVAFHIRLLTHHGGVEKLGVWKSFIDKNYSHPDVKRIVQDDETMKKFKSQLAKWKQAFASAVAISPLILITGQGLGQTPSAAAALQIGSRLCSYGKPDLIQEIEQMLWHCIIGIAWCCWTSEDGLKTFLDNIQPLVNAHADELAEENWFTKIVDHAQSKGIVGFEVRLAKENREWLARTKAITGYPEISLPPYQRLRAVSMSTDRPTFPPPKRRYYECTDLDSKDLLPFPVADAATICPLLTYRVEFWGYRHYRNTWPNLPLKPVTIRTIRTQDLVVGGPLAVLVSNDKKRESMFDLSAEERRQHEAKAMEESSQWRRMLLEATSLSWNSAKPASKNDRKRARPISFIEEMSTESKKPKLERDSKRSSCSIVLPKVYSFVEKRMVTCEIFPMLSNEEDDRATIEGWNNCVVTNSDKTPLWYKSGPVRQSMIWILSSGDLKEFEPSRLIRDYEVLMYDVGLRRSWNWSLHCLNRVGDLDASREVQDHQRRMDPEKREDINVAMSFREIFDESRGEDGRSLNALNLPRAGQGIEPIPYLSWLSAHKTAFDQTEDLPEDLFPQEFPKRATTWSLVSTRGAITYIHSDSQGVGTAIRVVTGRKLWYIFRRLSTKDNDSRIDEYLREWEPGFIPSPEDWAAEVILLEPGTCFFMRPDTHHAVITVENSIVAGEHFFACSTISRSVAGYVHTAMLDFSITNILHLELRPLFLRMMCYFSQNIRSKNTLALDVPDIYSREGFLDLVALGNLCLFASALNVDPEEGKPAVMVAVNAYMLLLRWASRNVSLITWSEEDGMPESGEKEKETLESDTRDVLRIDPGDFARNSAAHFARSLILYASEVKDQRQERMLNSKVLTKRVTEAMDAFMDTVIPNDFIEAYKAVRSQRMHFKPRFVVTRSGNISDVGALRDIWNSIEPADFDSDYDSDDEEDGDDDGDHGAISNLNRNSTSPESDSDADASDYRPPKPRKGRVAQISASLEESTRTVSNSNAMNVDVNLDAGEACVAPIPASGNDAMIIDEGEAQVTRSPAMINDDAMDLDDNLRAGATIVKSAGPTYQKLYSPDPWTIEGWRTIWREYFVMDKCEKGLDGQCLLLETSDKYGGEHILKTEDLQPLLTSYTEPFSMNLMKTILNLMILAEGRSKWFYFDSSPESLPVNVTKTWQGLAPHHIDNDHWVIIMVNVREKNMYLLDSVVKDRRQRQDIMKPYATMLDKVSDPQKNWTYRSWLVPKYSSVDSSVFCSLLAWLLITETIIPAVDAPFWNTEIAGAGFRLELIHFLKHVTATS